METLQGKLESILSRNLADGRTELETLPNGHVCGDVISSDFAGKSYEERRKHIRNILDGALSRDEVAQVSTLLTFTPQEWAYQPREAS